MAALAMIGRKNSKEWIQSAATETPQYIADESANKFCRMFRIVARLSRRGLTMPRNTVYETNAGALHGEVRSGKIPSRCALCSSQRKKPAMAKNPSSTKPLFD